MAQIGEQAVVQLTPYASASRFRNHRELDELKMAADPSVNFRAKLARDEVRPILSAFAGVTPREPNQSAVIMGESEAVSGTSAMTVPRRYRPLVWIVYTSERRVPDAKNSIAVCRRVCARHDFNRAHAFIVAGEGRPP